MRENKTTARIISSKPNTDDTSLDTNLRPKRLVDFIGQDKDHGLFHAGNKNLDRVGINLLQVSGNPESRNRLVFGKT